MKKLITGAGSVAAALALSACLVACSSNNADEVAKSSGAAAGKVAAEVEQTAKKASEVKIGETITVPDRYELTFSSYEWLDELKAKSGSTTCIFENKADGVSYLVLKGTLKNLSSHESLITGSPCGIENLFLVNDQYEYKGKKAAYGNGTSALSVDSLVSVNYWVYATIPDEVKEQFKNAKVTLNVLEEKESSGGIPAYDPFADPVATYTISLS